MKITPLDIEKQQFKKALRGYSVFDVNAFLGLVAREYGVIASENIALSDEIKRKAAELSEHRSREEALKDTMISAQKAVADIKESALREAAQIKAEAEFQAEKIITAAEQKRLRVVEEINELRRQKLQWLSHLGALIESHKKLLDVQKGSPEPGPGAV